MNYNKKTIMDVDVAGKKILLRCDFNVPQDKATGEITSDKRIVAALPTIRYLLDKGAAVIACSHLGKPKGEWKEKLSLAPVAKRLSELLGREVIFAKDIVGEDAKAKAAALKGGEILLLENLRFDPREEKNDPSFAKELAAMAELYVSDAFGTVHRAHASTAGVAAFLPAVSGLLVAKELEIMGKALDDRVGCAMLMQLLANDYECDFYGVFTVQEEVGLRGMYAAAYSVAPDVVIVLEGTTANDMPEVKNVGFVTKMSHGPAISFMDNATIVSPDMFKALTETANAAGIKWQPRQGTTGANDQGPAQRMRAGCKTGCISVPCRYIHSPASIADIDDIMGAYALADAFLKNKKFNEVL